MNDSLISVGNISIGFSYNQTDGDTTTTAAKNFKYTRSRFNQAPPNIKKIVQCLGPGEFVNWMPVNTFCLLRQPDEFVPNGDFLTPPETRCCNPCLPFFYIKPDGKYVKAGGAVNTLAGTQGDIFARVAGITIFPSNLRQSVKIPSNTINFIKVEPTLKVEVQGKSGNFGEIAQDQEVSIKWQNGSKNFFRCVENYEWTDPDGIIWRFKFFRDSSFSFIPFVPIITFCSDANILLEADNRFRLSAEIEGGRIGFIGKYGKTSINMSEFKRITHLNSTAGVLEYKNVPLSQCLVELSDERHQVVANVTWQDAGYGQGNHVHQGFCPKNWTASEEFVSNNAQVKLAVLWGS